MDADVLIVGAGLAGLVAARELTQAGRKVIIIDQEPEESLGGQAFWSFGGLFLVNSPEQRRLGIRDSSDLALQDWLGSAGFDREDDLWPRRWAHAYVDFAAGEKRAFLRSVGIRIFPVVGWAERGGYLATGHGNSVPRFHIAWGTGPGVLAPFVQSIREAEKKGLAFIKFRHRVTGLRTSGSTVDGVRGKILGTGSGAGAFEYRAQAVIVASGGMGGNHDMVRRHWPKEMGKPPSRLLQGVPDFVDGSMFSVLDEVGGRLINMDRMWHYPEGIMNYAPVWSRHGIRILSGPSPLWLDAAGRRLPPPLFPGFDSLGALRAITAAGHDYSWFLLNQRILQKEFALSGSEQNPDLSSGSILRVARSRRGRLAAPPVEAFKEKGEDFIVRNSLADLVTAMNELSGTDLIEVSALVREVKARDDQTANRYGKDAQLNALWGARAYIGDRLIRVARPHRLLDPKAGPLVAVRLRILTRKTLGGVETDLESRVLGKDGKPIAGLYAAGEVAGFGGGGVHGYRSLEGTFLGGCIFSGRAAGRAASRSVV